MKRLMILFAALAAVACAKNNVAEDPAPAAQYLNLTISDFPALESATKSGEVYGKTAWEDGDELLIEFVKHANGGNIFTDNGNIVSTTHLATYSDGEWTLGVPILVSESDLSNSFLQIYYRQGLKWNKEADMTDLENMTLITSDGQVPTIAQRMQSELLSVHNLVRSMDHTITFNKIVDDKGQLVSSILGRTNRVRIHYNGSGSIESIRIRKVSGSLWYGNHYYLSGLSNDISIPLDENNEAIVYLDWEFYDVAPVLAITTTSEHEIALPYGENDQVDAPYPFYELEFSNPIASGYPHHYNAYAYSIVVN